MAHRLVWNDEAASGLEEVLYDLCERLEGLY